MCTPSRRRRTFTLIELAVVLAVMMVLAAIALPTLNEAILRSKRAEAWTNVDGIDAALMGYIAAEGDPPPDPVGITYPDSTTLGRGVHAWAPTPPEWPLGASWRPTGGVRCGYHYETGANSIALSGVCDVNDTDRFYVDVRTLALPGLSQLASATYCCPALYAGCVASTDCY